MSREQPSLEAFEADADRLLDRLDSLYRRIGSEAQGLDVELYHRASLTLRVIRRMDGETPTRLSGTDEGLALRVLSGREESAFAACSGSAPSDLRWALRRCRESLGPGVERWSHQAQATPFDREAVSRPPSQDDLQAWLGQARQAIGPTGRPLEAWIEVATTVESWVAAGGLRASRSRTRAWALLRTRSEEELARVSKPVLVATRRWPELPIDGWRTMLEDRGSAGEASGQLPPRPATVLFNPECSATLVLALVKALHTGDHGPGFPVGPAWKLVDDPGDPDALLGGSFDDAGFPTRRKQLADGERSAERIAGPGHYRRPSFRDRPGPLPSDLAVLAGGHDSPRRGVLVTGLSLHAPEPGRWVLEVDGALLDGGLPGPPLKRAFIAVDPRELVRRCVAAVGPSRRSHLGVRTPALVFEDLTVANPAN